MLKKTIPLGLVGICVASAIALPAVANIVFGLLGVTPEDPTWPLVPLLGSILAIMAGRLPLEFGRGIRCKPWSGLAKALTPNLHRSLIWLSRGTTGSLLGLFYGGRWTDEDPRGAIAGLILGLLISIAGGGWLTKHHPKLERSLGMAIAFWAAYGLWFWFGAWTLAALSLGQWQWGCGYGLIAAIAGYWAWLGLLSLGQPGKNAERPATQNPDKN